MHFSLIECLLLLDQNNLVKCREEIGLLLKEQKRYNNTIKTAISYFPDIRESVSKQSEEHQGARRTL